MPQHFLNIADVRAVLEHVSGAGIAEGMRDKVLFDTGLEGVFFYQASDEVNGHPLFENGEKEGFLIRVIRTFFQVIPDAGKGDVVNGYSAVFPVFPFVNGDKFFGKIDVSDIEVNEFLDPDSGAVERFDDGDVAGTVRHTPVAFHFDRTDKPVDFGEGGNIAGYPLRDFWDFHGFRRVCKDDIFGAEELEETADVDKDIYAGGNIVRLLCFTLSPASPVNEEMEGIAGNCFFIDPRNVSYIIIFKVFQKAADEGAGDIKGALGKFL